MPLPDQTIKYFDAAMELGRQVYSLVQPHFNEKITDDYEGVINLLFGQIMTKYTCSLKLIEMTFVQEAALLTRALYELVLNMSYIKVEGKLKARQFLDFIDFEQYRVLKKIYEQRAKESPEVPQIFLKQLGEIEPRYRKVKDKFVRKKHGRVVEFKSWHDLDVRTLAEVVGKKITEKGGNLFLDQYESLYRHSSAIVHGSPLSVNDGTMFSVISSDAKRIHEYASWLIIENMTLLAVSLDVFSSTFDWMPRAVFDGAAAKIVELTRREFGAGQV